MRKIFFILTFSVTNFVNAQVKSDTIPDSVVMVSNATVRNLIHQFTLQYTFPDVIDFTQDANGKWITSKQNFINLRYTATRAEVKQFLQANGISLSQLNGINSLKDALKKWGAIIVYVPPPQIN